MRKTLLFSVVVALCFMALAAPGATRAQSKTFTIGVSNGFVSSEWRTQMLQNLDNLVKEYQGQGINITLAVESADVDVPGQIQQIQNLVNKKVNAIIIDANDQKGLNSALQDAVDAGIVVIAVDEEISAKGVYNVAIDQTEWARMSAQWLADKLGGKGNVVIIEGVVGHPANEARMAGVKAVFDKYPGIKIVGRDSGKWDQATAQKVMANFLASIPQIDGVWTQDGGMAIGALTAVQTANPAKWPIMVGEARAGYLQLWNTVKTARPDFHAYGVVNPPGIAASGMRVAVELLTGGKVADGALQGATNNTLYVPIPYAVDDSNFQDQYTKVASQPGSYTLDSIITQDQAKALLAGQLKATPAATMSATMNGTMAATMASMSATMAATAAK